MDVSLKDKAQAVRRALAERKLLDARISTPDADELEDEALSIARTFADQSQELLDKRAIIAVATDRAEGAVVIYTKRPYSKTDQMRILNGLDGNLPIIFRALDLGTQGPDVALLQALPQPAQHNGRIACGTSISIANDRGAGTLGALVRDTTGQLYGLSCSHVIGGCGYMQTGMPVVAPGVQDIVPGWPDPQVIGHFHRALALVPGDPRTIGAQINLDAALFRVSNHVLLSSRQGEQYDTTTDIHMLTEEDEGELELEKVGRTTGHTFGIVRSQLDHAIEIDFKLVCYPEHGQVRKFEAQVYTQGLWIASSTGASFAGRGDSGALVVTRAIGGGARKAVGIVVAGSRDSTSALILPIKPIISALDVELVADHGT